MFVVRASLALVFRHSRTACALGLFLSQRFSASGYPHDSRCHYNPDAVLFDEELRAEIDWMKVLRVDAMHCERQHGVFAVECSQFIQSCRRIGVTHDFWTHGMQSSWQFPRHHEMKMVALREVFPAESVLAFYNDHDWHTTHTQCICAVLTWPLMEATFACKHSWSL
jgi:hypothetical protein